MALLLSDGASCATPPLRSYNVTNTIKTTNTAKTMILLLASVVVVVVVVEHGIVGLKFLQ